MNPAGLREGRIGLPPLAAVLSFLRQEGEPYRLVTARAGEYTADWTVADLSRFTSASIRAAPPALRVRLVMWLARAMVRNTFRRSRASVRWREGRGTVDLSGSAFCEVRDRVERPLYQFYVAAIERLLSHFGLAAEVVTEHCRATGGGQCRMVILVRAQSC